jgi:hypothetical protein
MQKVFAEYYNFLEVVLAISLETTSPLEHILDSGDIRTWNRSAVAADTISSTS